MKSYLPGIDFAIQPLSNSEQKAILPPDDSNASQAYTDIAKYEILYVTEIFQWQQAIEKACIAQICGLDIETTGLNPLQSRIRLVQLAVLEENKTVVYVADCFCQPLMEILSPLVKLLTNKGVIKIGHNLKFDLSFIRRALRQCLPVENLFDTMIANQLNMAGYYLPEKSTKIGELKKEKISHTLEALAWNYLGIRMDKSHQKSDWHEKLSQEQKEYAAKDAAVLLPLHKILAHLLTLNQLEQVAQLEFDCIPSVVEIELNGLPLNAPSTRLLLAEKIQQQKLLEQELITIAQAHGFKARKKKSQKKYKECLNPNSPLDLLDCFHLMSHQIQNTEEETLKELVEQGCSFAEKLLSYRRIEHQAKFLEKWLEFQHPTDDRLHPSYQQLGASTGRFTSAHPNGQQIPKHGEDGKELRSLFRVPEGRKIVRADLAGIELRIMAWLSKDKTMMEAFMNNADLHKITAASISGKEISQVTKEERQAAKAVNFLLIYGGQASLLKKRAKFEYNVSISMEEAESARRKFFQTYPSIVAWHTKQKKLQFTPFDHYFHRYDHGFYSIRLVSVRSASKRKRIWPNVMNKSCATTTQLFNTPDQATGADILKRAMGSFYRILLEKGWQEVKLIGTVHDELLLEVPANMADEVASLLAKTMETAGSEFITPVPVKAETSVADSWGE